MLEKLARAGLAIFFLAACIGCSAMLSSWFVTRQLTAALAPKKPDDKQQPAAAEPTAEIDFYQATGIGRDQLREYVLKHSSAAAGDTCLTLLTLQNTRGEYLANGRVLVRWDGGEQPLPVGKSSIIQLPLRESMLAGLKIVVPQRFNTLRQRSIAIGTAYDPQPPLDTSDLPFDVYDDSHIRSTITAGLRRMRAAGESITAEQLQQQLRRGSCQLDLAPPATSASSDAAELTPEALYRLRRESVVIIGHLGASGQVTLAAGVVLDAAGVVATNYHVVNKPAAVARGVLTWNGTVHPIREILAASRSADVAILKIEAPELQAAPLSTGDPAGADVTLVSHPNSRYYSLTCGHITRYWSTTSFGRTTLRMGVTAAASTGSSGAPLFNSRGEVTGIFSATENLGYQMVHRSAVPAATIRGLLVPASD